MARSSRDWLSSVLEPRANVVPEQGVVLDTSGPVAYSLHACRIRLDRIAPEERLEVLALLLETYLTKRKK